jgi:hypothetical protein
MQGQQERKKEARHLPQLQPLLDPNQLLSFMPLYKGKSIDPKAVDQQRIEPH